jgi:hypothetical protein
LLTDCRKGLQIAGVTPPEEEFCLSTNSRKRYGTLLQQAEITGHEEFEGKRAWLTQSVATRKTKRRDIKVAHKKQIFHEIAAEEREKATITTEEGPDYDADKADNESLADEADGSNANAEDDPEGRARYDTAEEPKEWRNVEEGYVIIMDDNGFEEEEKVGRKEWIRRFIKKVSTLHIPPALYLHMIA